VLLVTGFLATSDGDWYGRHPAFASSTPGVFARRRPRTALAAGGVAGLPTLYVYDHCPFCIRARMIFGIKGIKYNLVFLANDDVETPTALVGKKLVPILELPGQAPMGESLDIVRKIDEDEQWGAPVLKPDSGREDIKAWNKRVSGVMRLLVRPRYPKGFFPEFAFGRARLAFVRNHPIANPESGEIPDKPTWFDMGPEVWESWYDAHMQNTPALLKELNDALKDAEGLVDSEESVSPGGLSYDDIVFWDRLRGATLVKGVEFGPKVKAYLEGVSKKCDIPLLTDIAM
jgi:glutaredoxin 2